MSHDYNTRARKETEQRVLVKLEQNIIKSISELEDKVLNLQDIVIKNLQEDNAKLHAKCNYLEKVVSLEAKLNHLDQYGRRNNLVLSGIPDTVEDKDLESTKPSIHSDIDVTIGPHDDGVCHKIGLSGKNKSKKIIIRLANRRYAKKALINRKKLDSIDNTKYNFDGRSTEKLHHMKQLQDLFPDFVFSSDEESILNVKHDVVNVSSDSDTVQWVH